MRQPEAILHESVRVPLAKLHLRDAGLALLHRRQPQQKAGKSRTGAVVGSGLRGEAVGELVVSAILEETPHRPNITAVTRAELQVVTAMLPI